MCGGKSHEQIWNFHFFSYIFRLISRPIPRPILREQKRVCFFSANAGCFLPSFPLDSYFQGSTTTFQLSSKKEKKERRKRKHIRREISARTQSLQNVFRMQAVRLPSPHRPIAACDNGDKEERKRRSLYDLTKATKIGLRNVTENKKQREGNLLCNSTHTPLEIEEGHVRVECTFEATISSSPTLPRSPPTPATP